MGQRVTNPMYLHKKYRTGAQKSRIAAFKAGKLSPKGIKRMKKEARELHNL